MKKCPYCAEEIQDEAIVCRYCGRELPRPISQKPPSKAKSTMQTISNLFLGLAGLLICLILFLVVTNWTGGNSSSSNKAPSTNDAIMMCEEFVRQRLKSPDNVDFAPWRDAAVKNISTNLYQVDTWVLAQNSFGVRIKTSYACQVQYAGSDKWKLVSLDFDE